jgi:hypothetical protein
VAFAASRAPHALESKRVAAAPRRCTFRARAPARRLTRPPPPAAHRTTPPQRAAPRRAAPRATPAGGFGAPSHGAGASASASVSGSSTRAADAAYEELRGEYNFDKLEAFFKRRPWEARAPLGARGARRRQI